MSSAPSGDDFLPTATWETLKKRSQILQQMRQFFVDRGFVEVETPLLSRDSVVDLHIDPISISFFDDPRAPQAARPMWLQSSPEFAMKRLLAAGADKIFQIAKAFRAGEVGPLHNPEFTIVEWYRLGDDLERGIGLLEELAREFFEVRQVSRLNYHEAFEQWLGINPHTATSDEMSRLAESRGLSPPRNLESRDEWLNFLLATCVEPHLGTDGPMILFDYPASQAALAKTRKIGMSYEVAERFELYFHGLELANGYHELLDPHILRERNRIGNQLRRADGRYEVPEESRLLSAMQRGLPACSGVALGFDRMVMAMLGCREIREVIPFPIDRA